MIDVEQENSAAQAHRVVDAAIVFIVLLLMAQMWLLTATLETYLAGICRCRAARRWWSPRCCSSPVSGCTFSSTVWTGHSATLLAMPNRLFLILLPLALSAQTLPLDGTWRFALDRKNEGIDARWFERSLAGKRSACRGVCLARASATR